MVRAHIFCILPTTEVLLDAGCLLGASSFMFDRTEWLSRVFRCVRMRSRMYHHTSLPLSISISSHYAEITRLVEFLFSLLFFCYLFVCAWKLYRTNLLFYLFNLYHIKRKYRSGSARAVWQHLSFLSPFHCLSFSLFLTASQCNKKGEEKGRRKRARRVCVTPRVLLLSYFFFSWSREILTAAKPHIFFCYHIQNRTAKRKQRQK